MGFLVGTADMEIREALRRIAARRATGLEEVLARISHKGTIDI